MCGGERGECEGWKQTESVAGAGPGNAAGADMRSSWSCCPAG